MKVDSSESVEKGSFLETNFSNSKQIEIRVFVEKVVFFDEEHLKKFVGRIREIEKEYNCCCTLIEARF